MDPYAFMRACRPYFEDYVTRSTYHSNAIEGNTISLPETYEILWNKDTMRISATSRELYEAINHKYALERAMEAPDEPLSERLIKDIAVLINRNVDEIRGYRSTQVMLRGAEHIPPSPAEVPLMMMQLVADVNTMESDPFLRAATLHIRFERIHPFPDGNGRIGRILINRELMRAGEPAAVIAKDSRATYFQPLANCDYDGLAEMLRELSQAEQTRMQGFADEAGIALS